MLKAKKALIIVLVVTIISCFTIVPNVSAIDMGTIEQTTVNGFIISNVRSGMTGNPDVDYPNYINTFRKDSTDTKFQLRMYSSKPFITAQRYIKFDVTLPSTDSIYSFGLVGVNSLSIVDLLPELSYIKCGDKVGTVSLSANFKNLSFSIDNVLSGSKISVGFYFISNSSTNEFTFTFGSLNGVVTGGSAAYEEQKAQQAANSAVDKASDSIPDKSQGFISGISTLVKSMSYDGTEAYWTFPSIKIPSIAGVTDELVLNPEMKIDFTEWVNKIPSNILEIVQIVCTIALIVFCFKELYSVISYVLTLKGGGADE